MFYSFVALGPAACSLLTPPRSILIKSSSLKVLKPAHRSWLTDQTSSYPFRNQIVSFYSIVLLKSNSSWHRISRQGEGNSRISCETYLLATRYRNFRIIFSSMCGIQFRLEHSHQMAAESRQPVMKVTELWSGNVPHRLPEKEKESNKGSEGAGKRRERLPHYCTLEKCSVTA